MVASSGKRPAKIEPKKARSRTEIDAAELAKLKAETEKVQQDIANEQGWRLWLRPSTWATLLPAAAAVAAALYAINSDFFQNQSRLVEVQKEYTNLQQVQLAQDKADFAKQSAALEQQKTNFENDKSKLALAKQQLEADQSDFKKRQNELAAEKDALGKQQADFEQSKNKLVADQKSLDEKQQQLDEQTKKIDQALAEVDVRGPLDSILADDKQSAEATDARYGLLLGAISKKPELEALVRNGLGSTQNEHVKMLLARTLYLHTQSDSDLDQLLRLVFKNPATWGADLYFTANIKSIGGGWPPEAKPAVLRAVVSKISAIAKAPGNPDSQNLMNAQFAVNEICLGDAGKCFVEMEPQTRDPLLKVTRDWIVAALKKNDDETLSSIGAFAEFLACFDSLAAQSFWAEAVLDQNASPALLEKLSTVAIQYTNVWCMNKADIPLDVKSDQFWRGWKQKHVNDIKAVETGDPSTWPGMGKGCSGGRVVVAGFLH